MPTGGCSAVCSTPYVIAFGPEGTFTILSSAAAQPHQSGHSCILQHFISSKVGKRTLFAASCRRASSVYVGAAFSLERNENRSQVVLLLSINVHRALIHLKKIQCKFRIPAQSPLLQIEGLAPRNCRRPVVNPVFHRLIQTAPPSCDRTPAEIKRIPASPSVTVGNIVA